MCTRVDLTSSALDLHCTSSACNMLLSVQVVANPGRPLVPWTIVEMNQQECSFEQLFERILAGCFDCVTVSDDLKRATLQRSSVGSQKDALMVTSNSQSVLNVCEEFGRYVRLSVELNSAPSQPTSMSLVRNAFDVMSSSQRRLQVGDNGLPLRETVNSGRDSLYNDLISLMKEMGVRWDDPLTFGVPFIIPSQRRHQRSQRYFQDSQDTIALRLTSIESVQRGNLSRSEICTHALALQESLHASWFKKQHFKVLKEATMGLVSTLNAYSAYLQEKNKCQKVHHEMKCPAASPGDSSHLQYIPRIVSVSSKLKPIDDVVKGKECYLPVAVMDFAPVDRMQRYRYVHLILKYILCTCEQYVLLNCHTGT